MIRVKVKEFKQPVTSNKVFLVACELAGIQATHRQERKWVQGRGKAWNFRKEAEEKVSRI